MTMVSPVLLLSLVPPVRAVRVRPDSLVRAVRVRLVTMVSPVLPVSLVPPVVTTVAMAATALAVTVAT